MSRPVCVCVCVCMSVGVCRWIGDGRMGSWGCLYLAECKRLLPGIKASFSSPLAREFFFLVGNKFFRQLNAKPRGASGKGQAQCCQLHKCTRCALHFNIAVAGEEKIARSFPESIFFLRFKNENSLRQKCLECEKNSSQCSQEAKLQSPSKFFYKLNSNQIHR